MITFEYRFERPSRSAPWRHRFGAKIDRIAERLLRPIVVGFARGIIARAKEDGIIGNASLHELMGAIDKRLPR